MEKRYVYFLQANENFSGNVFLPYSVASIWAYCRAQPEISSNYKLGEYIFLRENVDSLVARMICPDVLGISTYIWNWEYSITVAQATKKRFPECLVVLGGPQVPNNSNKFFSTHPYIDLLVHFEGELAFSKILTTRLQTTELNDFRDINGITIQDRDHSSIRTPPSTIEKDLSKYPSPYISGTFDDILQMEYSFHAYQETHRGCPYSCTFCDWGSAVHQKVRAFSDARVVSEIDWFGQNKIEYLLNCDANFGILKRDEMIADTLINTKIKYGYPKIFLASYAKNAGKRIFDINVKLNKYQLTKGVNLSLQSLDDATLVNIKRKNISIDNFEKEVETYTEQDIKVTTEIIMGLPGETLDSFCDGLDRLINAGQHDGLAIYRSMLLLNSEMNDEEYRKKHAIKTVKTPMTMNHGTYPGTGSMADIIEYQDTVIETSTMTLDDFKGMFTFSWAIQTFHCLALTRIVAEVFCTRYSVRYRSFYETLLQFAKESQEMVIGTEYSKMITFLDKVIKGKGFWHLSVPEYGEGVNWPIEEVSFVNFIKLKGDFYEELKLALCGPLFSQLINEPVDVEFVEDLVRYQACAIVSPESPKQTININNDYISFLEKKGSQWTDCANKNISLELTTDLDCNGDIQRYAREVVWYGRKAGKYLYSAKELVN